MSLLPIPSDSSTNFVTAMLSPLSVKVPNDTIPVAVTLTALEILPEAISIVPSLNLPAVMLPLAVTVVTEGSALKLSVTVPSVPPPVKFVPAVTPVT